MTIETREELFTDRPAPWTVETFRLGGASIIAANGVTVMTVSGATLAAFIADAANAFAADEFLFIASDNNAQKITVLTIQRAEAREQLAAAIARIAELEVRIDALRDEARHWVALAASMESDGGTYNEGVATTFSKCARGLTAAMAGVEPAKE